jgi:LysM repeat protein
MDPKVFKTVELALMGGLLIVVLYLGGMFNDGESPIPAGTPLPLVTFSAPAAPAENNPAPTTANTEAAAPAEPTATLTLVPSPTATATSRTGLTYTIIPGDSCWSIAAQFNITLEQLIAANNLDQQCLIVEGNTLIIPVP